LRLATCSALPLRAFVANRLPEQFQFFRFFASKGRSEIGTWLGAVRYSRWLASRSPF